MFTLVQAPHYDAHADLLERMFHLRKEVFKDQLDWAVEVRGGQERDAYDELHPAYILWTDDAKTTLYGSLRLMPTTGPTLLYDTFRRTFPDTCDLSAPGIWEGTRMCVDEAALARDHPDLDPGRAFCLMLLALCEVALAHGIHTMISNYEPHMARIYRKAGAELDQLGRAEGYGKRPVCCGAFEVSERILGVMRAKLGVEAPLYRRPRPTRRPTAVAPSPIPARERAPSVAPAPALPPAAVIARVALPRHGAVS